MLRKGPGFAGFLFIFILMKKGNQLAAIIIFLGFTILCSNAQKNGHAGYNELYSEALRLYDLEEPTIQSDSVALNFFIRVSRAARELNDYTTAIDCLIKAGNIHQTYQRFSLSNQYYHQSLAINFSTINNRQFTYEAYLYLGSSCYFSNIIDSAQHYFEEASIIAFQYPGAGLPEVDRLYNSLGAIYFESANYLQAKNYFEKALLVASPADDNDYIESLAGIKSNIANCLMRLNQFDSALKIYKSLEKYSLQKEVTDIITQNTAHAFYELGNYDSALLLYNKLPFDAAVSRVKALNDIGRIYMNRKQWQRAEMIFDSAISINKKISVSIKNKDEALAYLYRSQLAARQGFTDEALTWCNEAIREVHLNFRWNSAEDLPDSVSQTVSPIALFDILQTKASILYRKFQITGRSNYLTAVINTYRKALQTANFIKLNFDNDEAKIFFNRNYQGIYNDAIKAAYEAVSMHNRHMDDYIFFLENYKGNVVYQNLQSVKLKSNIDVPDSIVRREKELKQQLAFYTSRINSNVAEQDAGMLQNRLLEVQVELSQLQKRYEKDELYSLYKYQASHGENSLKAIQSAIDKETALINYYVSDSCIYLLAISKNRSGVQKISTDSFFYRNVSSYFSEVYHHVEGRRYDGRKTAAFLYNRLLTPANSIISECSKWVIIPDGFLYYLPVETLVKTEEENEFVVLTKTVSYHYSFTLLLQNSFHLSRENSSTGTFAVAPFSARDSVIIKSGFSDLPYSGDEVNSPGGIILTGSQATKSRFIEQAGGNSIIHLATHASIGKGNSSNWIQFYPDSTPGVGNKLFVHEIYNLDLHKTELVILSACETAAGNTTAGDGLLSLSRAFIYAGSDGIVSTLWKTEDMVTAYLMKQFHAYLKKNKPVEKALQMAKIDLLKNREIGSQYKTPNYWGNFIYVGKIAPVENKAGLNFLPVIGSFAVLCLFFYAVSRKR